MKIKSEFDNKNICRTCLKESDDLISMFDVTCEDDNNLKIITIISFILNSEISINDNLPKTICEDCIKETNRAYKFRQLCINSDKSLRESIPIPEMITLEKEEVMTDENDLIYKEIKQKLSVPKTKEDEDFENDRKLDKETQTEKMFVKEVEGKLNIETEENNDFGNDIKINKRNKIKKKEIRYKCKFCDKLFPQKQNVQVHMRIHTGEKPFQCNLCELSFMRNLQLVIHLRKHENLKPFQCSICKKAFITKPEVKKHMDVHATEKPYKCKMCEKAFINNSKLKKHLLCQHDYKCSQCSMAFGYKIKLKKHIQDKHNDGKLKKS